MRLDRTIDGNHPSVEGYRRLAELIPPPGRSKDAEGKSP
jgi:lysophospholipase L1-like esterase